MLPDPENEDWDSGVDFSNPLAETSKPSISSSQSPYSGVFIQNHIENLKDIFRSNCGVTPNKFDYICLKLFSDATILSALTDGVASLPLPFHWNSGILEEMDWIRTVVGILPDIGAQLASTNSKNAEDLWELACNHGQYLGIKHYIIDTTLTFEVGRMIQSTIHNLNSKGEYKTYFYLKLRLNAKENEGLIRQGLLETWNEFRTMMNYDVHLGIALDISNYTRGCISEFEEKRWCSEPVRMVIVNEEAFIIEEQTGKACLKEELKCFLEQLIGFHASPVVILKDEWSWNGHLFKQYFDNLKKKVAKNVPKSKIKDSILCACREPLQPLSENISQHFYNGFLKDEVKYVLYEKAIKKALEVNKEKFLTDEKIVIVVAGVGHAAPLVKRTVDAAKQLGMLSQLKIYALGKNIFALNCVVQATNPDWKDIVSIHVGDIRTWKFPEKAHIIVSELLGSFGDNELSPECLHTAHEHLKDGGIIIPQKCMSYIQPISNPRLRHVGTLNCKTLERGWVTSLNKTLPFSSAQELFTFNQPATETTTTDRYKELSFPVEGPGILTGFGGFFEADLYENITISTHPERHTPNMRSWDPLWFNLKDPVLVEEGDIITLLFWRKSDKYSVWYEWAINSPKTSHIHNLEGKFWKLDKHC